MKENILDDSMLSGLNRRDKSAFDSFFKEVFPSLLLYTEKIVADKFEAEDISLLAFARLWEKMQTGKLHFTTLSQVRAYVYFTAKNESISFLRKDRWRRVNDKLFQLYVSGECEHDPTERTKLESLVLDKVFSEIDKLPGKCQEVVKLCYFSELSRAEVASILNLSKHTVDAHIKTAIRKLKSVFSEKDLALLATIFFSFSRN